MKFKILNVKGYSVRVKTGIITFDVLVFDVNGKLKIKVPNNIYIADIQDFNSLAGAVLAEYNHSLGVNHTNENTERENRITI